MKKKLGKIAAIFTALMVVLTIVSRVANGFTIAKITVKKPEALSIDHTLEETTQVKQNNEIMVSTVADLIVNSVKVTPGQTVVEGEELFSVSPNKLNAKISTLEAAIKQKELKKSDTISRAKEDYNDALSSGEKTVAIAESSYNDAVDAYNQYVNTHPIKPDNLEEEADTSQYYNDEQANSLLQTVKSAESSYNDAVNNANTSIKTAKRGVEDADNGANEENGTDATGASETGETSEQILQQLKELQAADGKVKAPRAGMVTKVAVGIGDKTTSGAAVLIADATSGSKVTVSVDKEFQKYVNTGTKAEITGTDNNGDQQTLTDLPINSITQKTTADGTNATSDTADPNSQDGNASITIQIPVNTLAIGTTATVKLENTSTTYPLCIPIAALHQDEKNQYYVLVTDKTEGIMGEELVARKLLVKVQEKNDKYAALADDGTLSTKQDVIVESSKEIQEGSRLRLKAQ